MEPAVRVKNISKIFGDELKALNDISFTINENEVVSLLGESGSGKTTLLSILAGLEDASSGTVEIFGEEITGPEKNLVPGYDFISLVFQDFKLERFKTIRENIASPIYYLPVEDREDRVDELLTLCRLQEKADNFPHELSGGQQQRCSIAVALAKEPELVLLDEPFSNLDSRMKSIIREEIIGILREAEVTVIMVSHDHSDAMAVADRILIVEKGKIIQSGKPQEIYSNPVNQYAAEFLGPVNMISVNGSRKLELVRPEHISLKKNGKFEGEVIRSVFQGMHHHLHLKTSISKNSLLLYSTISKKPGDKIRFDIN